MMKILKLFHTVSVAVAVVAAVVPTLECFKVKKDFKTSYKTRDGNFWAKALRALARGDAFETRENMAIRSALRDEKFVVELGWVLYVVWGASGFAIVVIILVALSCCCCKKGKGKKARSSYLVQLNKIGRPREIR